MFRNKLIKLLTAATFAVIGIGAVSTVSNASTVQASAFHYLRKDRKLVTLGYGENLPIRIYQNGKHIYANDDPKDIQNYTDDDTTDVTLLKTHGWKYINGVKYYKLYNYYEDSKTFSAYVPAKYFTKKYNDMSYLTVYRVNSKIKALADDMQHTDDGMWYGKGDIILVNNFSLWNHDKYVDTITPMWDGKHNAMKMFDYTEANFGGEITPSDFKNHCSKASANTKFLMNHGEDWYTNSSLARGGMYHKGHFYKVYSR
jgi:hypothetical protein